MSVELEESRPAALALMPLLQTGLEEALESSSISALSLSGRVKSLTAVREKLRRVSGSRVNDFMGFRIILANRTDIAMTLASIETWREGAGLRPLGVEDRLECPGLGGYRAVHLDFVLAQPEAHGLSDNAGIEVQLTTAILAAHARACHELVYRAPAIGADSELAAQLHKLGEAADRLDRDLAELLRLRRG